MPCACGREPTLLPNGKVPFSRGFNGSTGFSARNCTTPRPEVSRSPEACRRHVLGRRQQCSGTATSCWRPEKTTLSKFSAIFRVPNYSPTTGKFGITGRLNTPRFLHTAHWLARGQVLTSLATISARSRAWSCTIPQRGLSATPPVSTTATATQVGATSRMDKC